MGGAAPGQATGLNAVAGHAMHGMYSHAGSFPNNAMMRPTFMGSPGVTDLSPAEVYRQRHEVSATVCTLKIFHIPKDVKPNRTIILLN